MATRKELSQELQRALALAIEKNPCLSKPLPVPSDRMAKAPSPHSTPLVRRRGACYASKKAAGRALLW